MFYNFFFVKSLKNYESNSAHFLPLPTKCSFPANHEWGLGRGFGEFGTTDRRKQLLETSIFRVIPGMILIYDVKTTNFRSELSFLTWMHICFLYV